MRQFAICSNAGSGDRSQCALATSGKLDAPMFLPVPELSFTRENSQLRLDALEVRDFRHVKKTDIF